MPTDGGTHFGTHLGRIGCRHTGGDVVVIEDARIRLDERRMSAHRDTSPTQRFGEFTRAFDALRSLPSRCRDPSTPRRTLFDPLFVLPYNDFEKGGTHEVG
ncbi:hypothetical protein RW1_014_00050 [Rhodococcus wratislaviensis NBRC 100605]|uniref:Uncharacterized protein n=1 Tax=Rhodococcus wratislaviensis NBRC 100605 TaxID=1219028 RepID=X0PPD8_RHOWR|nr:hypothetical protein RW1_014_00050 [Rhodococcus wratislaviensis NBRC 100605]